MRGPIKVRLPADEPKPDAPAALGKLDTIELPPNAVLDAGVAKFMEFANRHWPQRQKDGSFKLESFNYRDLHHLRTALGMVYFAMKAEDK